MADEAIAPAVAAAGTPASCGAAADITLYCERLDVASVASAYCPFYGCSTPYRKQTSYPGRTPHLKPIDRNLKSFAHMLAWFDCGSRQVSLWYGCWKGSRCHLIQLHVMDPLLGSCVLLVVYTTGHVFQVKMTAMSNSHVWASAWRSVVGSVLGSKNSRLSPSNLA